MPELPDDLAILIDVEYPASVTVDQVRFDGDYSDYLSGEFERSPGTVHSVADQWPI